MSDTSDIALAAAQSAAASASAAATAAQEAADRLEEFQAGGGGGSSSLTVVSGGTVDLDNSKPDGYLIGYKVTATTTIEGVSVTPGAYAFIRDEAAGGTGWRKVILNLGDVLSAAPPDTTAPTASGYTAVGNSNDSVTHTVTGAADAGGGLDALAYRFSNDGASMWSAWQASNTLTTAPIAGAKQPRAQVRDVAGNTLTLSAANIATSLVATIMEDTPDLYLPLDDAAGTTAPRELGSRVVTPVVTGGVTFGSTGLASVGTSATFDGSTGYITVETGTTFGAGMASFTVGAIINSGVSQSNAILGLPSTMFNLNTFQNVQAFGVSAGTNNNYWVVGATAFIHATYDGTNVRFYKNGTQIAVVAKTGNVTAGTANIRIGSDQGAGNKFNGRIAHVFAKAGVLTPERILAHAQAAGLA